MNQIAETASGKGKNLKILSIIGTRPEAIKMASVLKELDLYPGRILSKLCVTAQHRELLDQMLRTFNLRPDYDLDIMRSDQSPAGVASATISMLEPILEEFKPDWVLVQGDTTSAMAASLVSQYAQVKVGHIEAGLRTQDPRNPFPEEMNRKVIGSVASLHFAPTIRAKENLLREGVAEESIKITGNTGIDSLFWAVNQIETEDDAVKVIVPEAQKYIDHNKKSILVTAHRRENQGKPLEDICLALKQIADKYKNDVEVIFPVHMNPLVNNPVHRILGNLSNILLIPPADYLQTVFLMKHAYLILTDSGGIQEEAPALGKPVLVLRNVTERVETIQNGTSCLVGTDTEFIVKEVSKFIEEEEYYKEKAKPIYFYGDGKAAKRIVSILMGEDPSPFVQNPREIF